MEVFLTSKKASATVVFLVISVLIISSGVIITNQIKKSNDDNVAGTGLVLLDNKQDISQDSDSSDEQITFTFTETNKKSSSKRSSGGGGGGGSSLNSQTYNEPEIPDNEESANNQTSDNQTSLNTNETIDNQTSGNQTGANSTDSSDVEILSDGQIFEQNGTTYIVRDGAAYILSVSSSTYYIEFNPPLPSSVCENEMIDITVKGYGSYSPSASDLIRCAFNGFLLIGWNVKLMEDDFFGDDLVRTNFGVSTAHSSASYPYCTRFYFETTFSNVDLSDWIIPDPGNEGEFYAKIEDDSGNEGDVQPMSTSNYDIYGYVNGECKCLSGPCCDLLSRPYKYKLSGSQPTGYTDYYYCSGTNSPISTSYVVKKDYYCTGSSSDYTWNTFNYDTCGTCEYCQSGYSSCNYYGTSSVCGTKDCDYLDTTCRNYHDVAKYCNGGGSCSISGVCDDYTNEPKHTSCGTNQECDGSGTCVTCTTHSYTNCWDNDVYWYNACDNREEKKQECGISDCSSWTNFCKGDELWKKRSCVERGCSGNSCFGNWMVDEQKIETCQWGCENGKCKPNPNIACFFNRDCGTDDFSGSPWCSNDDVYQWYTEYICNNPGTEQSFCSDKNQRIMKQDCGIDIYSSNYCYNDDVYQNFTDRGCLNGECFENITVQFVQECGEPGCLDGECVYVECYNHSMCDPDNDPDNNYIGDPYCSNDDVWQNYINYTCHNPGAGNSYCSNSTAPDLKEPCGSDYCETWGGNYCKLDDVYHQRTCHDKGCSDGACFDNTSTEEEKVEDCGISEYTGSNYCYGEDVYRDYITRSCSSAKCKFSISDKKIEDCIYGCISGRCKIQVCSYGMCYYV